MPISAYFNGNGRKVMNSMKKTYSDPKKAKQVFYATANKRGVAADADRLARMADAAFMSKEWTEDRVKKLRAEGMGVPDIATRLGLKEQVVKTILESSGRAADSLMSQSDEERLRKQLMRAGKTGIEAYGVRGFKNAPWRKAFKSHEEMSRWADKNDATVQGSRSTDAAKPSIQEQVRAYMRPSNANRPELYPDAGSEEFINEWMRQSSGRGESGQVSYQRSADAKRLARIAKDATAAVPRFMESKEAQMAPGVKVYHVTGKTGTVKESPHGGRLKVDVDGGGPEAWEVNRTYRYHDPIFARDSAAETFTVGRHPDQITGGKYRFAVFNDGEVFEGYNDLAEAARAAEEYNEEARRMMTEDRRPRLHRALDRAIDRALDRRVKRAFDALRGRDEQSAWYKLTIANEREAEIATEHGDGTKFKPGDIVLHNERLGKYKRATDRRAKA